MLLLEIGSLGRSKGRLADSDGPCPRLLPVDWIPLETLNKRLRGHWLSLSTLEVVTMGKKLTLGVRGYLTLCVRGYLTSGVRGYLS